MRTMIEIDELLKDEIRYRETAARNLWVDARQGKQIDAKLVTQMHDEARTLRAALAAIQGKEGY